MKVEKPTVVDEDDLLIKADRKKARPICNKHVSYISLKILCQLFCSFNSPVNEENLMMCSG